MQQIFGLQFFMCLLMHPFYLNLVCLHFAAQVWDTVEKYDTGCTPGGGKDSMSVFYDAGLLFESSTASGTPHRLGDTTYSGLIVFSSFLSHSIHSQPNPALV